MAGKLRSAGKEAAGANGALLAQREEVMAAKPEWDNQVARYDADKELWERRQSTISAAGPSDSTNVDSPPGPSRCRRPMKCVPIRGNALLR